jgi:hypothetical protein
LADQISSSFLQSDETVNGEMAPQPKGSRSAPWYDIPQDALVCVEHPFIVKNDDRIVQSIGGSKKVELVCVPYSLP